MTNEKLIQERLAFRCINCLEPCSSLYVEYGNPNNVDKSSISLSMNSNTLKLHQCNICQQIVDPYCEREWLLVVLDLILLRQLAYRHLLFNNDNVNNLIDLNKNNSTISKSNLSSSSHNTIDVQKFWTYVITCSILRVYHIHQSIGENIEGASATTKIVGTWVIEQFLLSFVGILMQCFVLIVLVSRFRVDYNNNNNNKRKQNYYSMILKAVLWSSIACYVATSLIEIWENSTTTRYLGCSILLLIYQWMAIQQTILSVNVVRNIYQTTNNKNLDISAAVKSTFVLVTAVLVRESMIFLSFKIRGIDTANVHCPGIEWNVFGRNNSESSSYLFCIG